MSESLSLTAVWPDVSKIGKVTKEQLIEGLLHFAQLNIIKFNYYQL